METPVETLVEAALSVGLDGARRGQAVAVAYAPKSGERRVAGPFELRRAVNRSRNLLGYSDAPEEAFVVARDEEGLVVYRTASQAASEVEIVPTPLKRPLHHHRLARPPFAPKPGPLRLGALAA